jgi:hypothetical protein
MLPYQALCAGRHTCGVCEVTSPASVTSVHYPLPVRGKVKVGAVSRRVSMHVCRSRLTRPGVETAFIVSRSLGLAVLQFRVRTDITDNRSRVSRASTLDCRPDGTGLTGPRRGDHGLLNAHYGVLICAGFW